MHRKVLLLSSSFERAKGTGAELAAAATRGSLIDDPHAPVGAEQRTARWKVRSVYGDIGLQYRADETVAYVASRMPAIYAACHRVLREVQELPCPIFVVSVPSELNSPSGMFWWTEEWLCRSVGGRQILHLRMCWTSERGQAQHFGA